MVDITWSSDCSVVRSIGVSRYTCVYLQTFGARRALLRAYTLDNETNRIKEKTKPKWIIFITVRRPNYTARWYFTHINFNFLHVISLISTITKRSFFTSLFSKWSSADCDGCAVAPACVNDGDWLCQLEQAWTRKPWNTAGSVGITGSVQISVTGVTWASIAVAQRGVTWPARPAGNNASGDSAISW